MNSKDNLKKMTRSLPWVAVGQVASRSPAFVGVLGLAIATLLAAAPAFAHHAMGGNLPTTAFEGFFSGLAHPVIGPDHLAFVVASGLVALGRPWGWAIPVSFALSALAGTGLHLASANLPANELWVSLSVVGVGALLVAGRSLPLVALGAIAAAAGIVHGYAYGESIVGAGMTPLVSYLLGFTTIQLAIALGVRALVSRASLPGVVPSGGVRHKLQLLGSAIVGLGLAYGVQAIGG